jgi:aspartyl-tRNA synthetase
MILGTPSIRDVMAFPKNRSAVCPLTRAPATVEAEQLQELHIGLRVEGQADGDSLKATEGHPPEASGARPERISRAELDHVARLARLRLSEEEAVLFQKDLNSVLDYAASLDELPTDGVRPMSHVLEIRNVWREDEEVPFPDTARILNNAPDRQDDYMKVPKILEG